MHDSPSPLNPSVMLMRHYEQTGEFAKAEQALFAVIGSRPVTVELLNFGIGFYQRLLQLNDSTLEAGNLTREGIKAVLAGLEKRKAEAI